MCAKLPDETVADPIENDAELSTDVETADEEIAL
jgi:hypothetical protein